MRFRSEKRCEGNIGGREGGKKNNAIATDEWKRSSFEIEAE
jgi:hypothetical protein